MSSELLFMRLPRFTREEIEAAVSDNDRSKLIYVCLSAAYHGGDWKYAQDLSISLSNHQDKTVRGNAILALSYIARSHKMLEKHLVEPILLRALRDEEEEFRMRVMDAIEEINEVMGWDIAEMLLETRRKNT
ncbi:MAG: hypothetical protein GTO18_21195 [Anaerolineales bacterium]|nr:hypothetical protein [Anaerolineales bacterium]